MVASDFGDDERARNLYARSAELARATGDTFLIASVANNYGDLELRKANFEAAEALFREALERGREQHNMYRVVGSLTNLGFSLCELGDMLQARRHFVESLGISLEFGYLEDAAHAVLGLARCERDPLRQSVLIGVADAILDEVDASLSGFEAQLRQHMLETTREELGPVHSDGAVEEGRAMTPDEAVAYALGASTERNRAS
jgi:tetratricopeptide (TPR) repeat protein